MRASPSSALSFWSVDSRWMAFHIEMVLLSLCDLFSSSLNLFLRRVSLVLSA